MNDTKTKQLLEALEWRYAVKQFDSTKKISEDVWSAIEKSLILTPSSYGLQPWKFYVIEDAELKKKLKPVSWNQPQIEQCSHLVVFAALQKVDETYVKNFIDSIQKTRGVPRDSLKAYEEMMIGDVVKGPRSQMVSQWTARQCYIALGNLMTSAALLGVDACPMEGIDTSKYDEILGLSSTAYRSVVACPLGYRSLNDGYAKAPKVRFKKEELFVRR
jgi:nitroreductase